MWKVVFGLNIQQSSPVDANEVTCAFSSLVGDNVAVSRGCVLTRDWVTDFVCNFKR